MDGRLNTCWVEKLSCRTRRRSPTAAHLPSAHGRRSTIARDDEADRAKGVGGAVGVRSRENEGVRLRLGRGGPKS